MQDNYRAWDIKVEDFPKEGDIYSQIKFILQYAILAPSTHNTQPWMFRIRESKCEVYYNPKLILPEADSKMRDLYISMGCCLENLILASKYFNIFESVLYGPFDKKEQVAAINFKNYSGNRDDQYTRILDTIIKRVNARGVFQSEKVPEDILKNISIFSREYLVDDLNIHWIVDQEKITKIASLTADGLKIAYNKISFRKEMSQWMNNSLTKKKEGIPGYALKMPLALSFILPRLVKLFNIGNFLAKKNYQSLCSAPLVVVITSKNESPKLFIKTGRLAERTMLEFQSVGWQTSIFVASIEIGELYKEVKTVVGTDQLPQFLFAVGKINSLHKQTPRHPIEEKIILS